jgi:hypothetical protein
MAKARHRPYIQTAKNPEKCCARYQQVLLTFSWYARYEFIELNHLSVSPSVHWQFKKLYFYAE